MIRKPKLVVEISARDGLSRQLGTITARARRSLGGLARAARGIGLSLGAGVAAAGAGAFLAYRQIRLFTDEADQLAKDARRLDVPIGFLQEFGYVAERSGIQAESFAKATKKFVRNLGDLAAGTGSLSTLLRAVAPDLAEVLTATADPAKAFEIMLDALRALPTSAQRSSLAVAAFGRAGQDMLTIVEQTPEALARLLDAYRAYGNQIDMHTGRQAENFNDTIEDAFLALKSLRTEIATELLPLLTPLARGFANALSEHRADIAYKISDGIKGLAEWVASTDWRAVGADLQGVASGLSAIASAMGSMLRFTGRVSEWLGDALPAATAAAFFALKRHPVAAIVLGTVAALQSLERALTADFGGRAAGDVVYQGRQDALASSLARRDAIEASNERSNASAWQYLTQAGATTRTGGEMRGEVLIRVENTSDSPTRVNTKSRSPGLSLPMAQTGVRGVGR